MRPGHSAIGTIMPIKPVRADLVTAQPT